ncbi:MAG: hypothetical protein WC389_10015 [Lutibacter sp.]|jgi:hypothetical protein
MKGKNSIIILWGNGHWETFEGTLKQASDYVKDSEKLLFYSNNGAMLLYNKIIVHINNDGIIRSEFLQPNGDFSCDF